jgi:hypothetical protein
MQLNGHIRQTEPHPTTPEFNNLARFIRTRNYRFAKETLSDVTRQM